MPGRTQTLDSHSVADTLAIGRRIGGVLAAGDCLALEGPLGSGKTHLVKGIASGLGVADERIVNSPTFVLVNEYDGRLHVCHLDAYRLADAAALLALGFEEMCDGPNVVLIEWADRVRDAVPDRAVWITLTAVGERDRRLDIRPGPEGDALAERIDMARAP